MKRRIFLILILSSCFLINVSCSSAGDIDKIGDAQHCLDKFARDGEGSLDDCELKVEGVTTPAAFSIRCAAGYIRDGFTAQGLVTAFSKIETVTSSNMADFLNSLVFDAAGTTGQAAVETNYSTVQTVYGHCADSLGKGVTLLATFSYLTNAVYNYRCNSGAGTCNTTATSTDLLVTLNSAYTDVSARGVALCTDLGTIAVNTREVSCTNGVANETLCEILDQAVIDAGGTTNKEAVGREFLEGITTL